MNPWHALTDSDAFRWFAKRGPGRAIFRSAAFSAVDLQRNRVRAAWAVRRSPHRFDDVKTFCFFVGHNKSGSSLLSGLLDAHPNVVLSDEVDALRYLAAGFPREQLFARCLKGAQAEARKGRVTARRLEPYSYAVPGWWQGRVDLPLVVGDSTTGTSTRRLRDDPRLLGDTIGAMGSVDVKLLQVIRNPFDPISVMMIRGRRSFANAIEHYFTACEVVAALRRRLGPTALLPVRYETFVSDPHKGLTTVCEFLGAPAETAYLDACAAIIRRQPDRSRDMVRWTAPWISTVERRAAAFDFLEGYSYAS